MFDMEPSTGIIRDKYGQNLARHELVCHNEPRMQGNPYDGLRWAWTSEPFEPDG